MKAFIKGKIKEDGTKVMVAISKKYPSEVLNNDYLNQCFVSIFPHSGSFSSEEKICYFSIFKEILKEVNIEKGQSGTEIIEELLFIGELMEKKKDVLCIEEELMNEANNFVRIAKEKGFEGKLWKKKNLIVKECMLIDWIELCKEEVSVSFN